MHNVKAWAEKYLLSLCDALVISLVYLRPCCSWFSRFEAMDFAKTREGKSNLPTSHINGAMLSLSSKT